MTKRIPNHTITDHVDAALNVAMVLVNGNIHYYSDEVFIRELYSRGYMILPTGPEKPEREDMLAVDASNEPSPDKRGD